MQTTLSKTTLSKMTILPCVALALALSATPVTAQDAGGTELTVAQSEEYGSYVADADGRALYMFEADTQGEEGTPAESSCYDACAEAWPPLIAQGEPAAGDQLDASLLGTVERRDGMMQVTYGGWPLYYYVMDTGEGSVAGQDVHGFGGGWYLVSPDGTTIE